MPQLPGDRAVEGFVRGGCGVNSNDKAAVLVTVAIICATVFGVGLLALDKLLGRSARTSCVVECMSYVGATAVECREVCE